MCVFVCVCVCARACVCINVYMCMHMCMYACMHIYRAVKDYQLPLIVFDINFHVGEALDTYATKKALNAKQQRAVLPARFAAPGN